jgi:hypothetical protein
MMNHSAMSDPCKMDQKTISQNELAPQNRKVISFENHTRGRQAGRANIVAYLVMKEARIVLFVTIY